MGRNPRSGMGLTKELKNRGAQGRLPLKEQINAISSGIALDSSNSHPDPSNYLHVWDFLAAGTRNSDQSHAAHNHDDSLEEVDTAWLRPVKKVRFTKETKT